MTLAVSGLSRRIDDKWILRDVSFEALTGQVFGIFGPSGSGKTTLIRLLTGVDRSGSGSITFDGRDLSKASSSQRELQFPAVHKNGFWQRIFGSEKPLSGETQLAAFEKALYEANGVLLLDDPFCHMDVRMRDAAIAKLRNSTNEKQLTVILGTGDYNEVFDACDGVGILVGGEIRQTGVPQEVYDSPNCAAVASIVGRNNIFYGRRLTSSKSDLPEFQTMDGEHRLFTRKVDVGTLGAINKDASLAIRPENIVISLGAAFPEDNLLKAVITGVRPRGASTSVYLDSNGLRLEALVPRLIGLNIGDECMLGLPPDRIQVLKQ